MITRLITKNGQKFSFFFFQDKQQNTLFYQIILVEDLNNEANLEPVTNLVAASPTSGPSIAKIFRLIESNKEELHIETYSLSQTTLEQVFLSFARKQFNPNEIQTGNASLSTRFSSNRANGNTNRGFYIDNDPATVVFKEMNV